ncbi:MAG TPA: hypothetical protein VGK84_13005 [Candidatus Tumulicola sp.]
MMMTIREFDAMLYRQLEMCLDGNYIGAGADEPTPAVLAGLRHSLDVANVDRECDCGDPDCRGFRVSGVAVSRESLRVRFRVHGELSVLCTREGELQHIEWLPDPPRGETHRYEYRHGNLREVRVCPFPE